MCGPAVCWRICEGNNHKKKIDLYAVLMDIKKGYDWVDGDALWKVLGTYWCGEKLIEKQ